MFEFDLTKLSLSRGILYFLILIFSVLPPFWFLFQFHLTIFKELELFKILLICLSVGFPIALVNGFCMFGVAWIVNGQDVFDGFGPLEGLTLFCIGALCNMFIFFIPSIINYFSSTFHSPTRICLYVEVALMGIFSVFLIIGHIATRPIQQTNK